MIGRMLIASLVVFALCGLWILAVQAGRSFARRHPEFGRYREEGGECGKSCGCRERSECRVQKSGVQVKEIQ
jgi:hypothetical protein